MTCPILSHLPVRSHVCTRSALCGPHSRPHARLRWRSRLRLRMSGLLARAWERAVPSVAEPLLNPPTTNPQFNRPSARYQAGSGCWRPAARLDCGSGTRLARAWDSQFIYRPRACLPRSLQPFPPVSPVRGGAFSSPPPANRLSFIQPRDPVRPLPRRGPAIQPAPALPSVAAFPLCAPAKSGSSGCSTGAAV